MQRAKTHLNICAVNSLLGKHKIALKQAEEAIKLMEKSLLPMLKVLNEQNPQETPYQQSGDNAEMMKGLKHMEILVLAYYNAGVEQEHMSQFNLCHYSYQNGLKIATNNFPPEHFLRTILSQASKTVVKKIVGINLSCYKKNGLQ